MNKLQMKAKNYAQMTVEKLNTGTMIVVVLSNVFHSDGKPVIEVYPLTVLDNYDYGVYRSEDGKQYTIVDMIDLTLMDDTTKKAFASEKFHMYDKMYIVESLDVLEF